METVIFVTPEILSDKSVVWNVQIGEAGPLFHACSEEDATEFADRFKAAVDELTADGCSIIVESWKAP